jgi:hypothetical protein
MFDPYISPFSSSSIYAHFLSFSCRLFADLLFDVELSGPKLLVAPLPAVFPSKYRVAYCAHGSTRP